MGQRPKRIEPEPLELHEPGTCWACDEQRFQENAPLSHKLLARLAPPKRGWTVMRMTLREVLDRLPPLPRGGEF